MLDRKKPPNAIHKSQITNRNTQNRKSQITNHKTSRNHQKTPLSNKHTASGVLGRGKKGHSAKGEDVRTKN